ncbi:hypothetical protein MO867_18630 [Microbulbifer sp. OS29]|uniref:Uncharacterized protein n=1 Tax=Microbulbifer okhotskensis TaxID=2926617 RepID=A0A9X2EQ47_9GAMM|nr:hypothetical protein [Microbulbifer okhotskensis]MCO1336352.1 hypothetical protein [Microbulbifer okhotskensis]
MKKVIATLVVNLGMSMSSFAAVDARLEDLYQKAVSDGGTAIRESYEYFKLAQEQDPGDPVALFYLGASETLMASESWLPWNKVSYAENGIARMDKALMMMEELKNPGLSVEGIPHDLLFKGIAATTFTKVPKFFNAFDRGYGLYHELMADPRIAQMPPNAISWIYCGALQAAELLEDTELATSWKAKGASRGTVNSCEDNKGTGQ